MIFYFVLLGFIRRCSRILTSFIYKKVKRLLVKSALKYFIVFSFIQLQSHYLILGQCNNGGDKAYEKLDRNFIEKCRVLGDSGQYDKQLQCSLKAVEETEKIQKKYRCFSNKAHFALSDAYYNLGNLQEALNSALKAFQFCETFNRDNCNCMSESKMRIGQAYEDMGQDTTAKKIYLEALELCEMDGAKLMEAMVLMTLGDLERSQGLFEEALIKFDMAENLIQFYGPKLEFSQRVLGRCNYNRGLIFFEQGKCESAFQKFEVAKNQSKMVHDRKNIAKCSLAIAKIHQIKSDFENALLNYQEAITISTIMKFDDIFVDSNAGIARIYTIQGKDEEAKAIAWESFKVAKESKNKVGMCNLYNIDARNMAVLFAEDSTKYKDNLFQAKTALTMAQQNAYKFGVAEAYINIAYYYLEKRDYRKVRKYSNEAFLIADSMGYTNLVVDALINLGDVCFRMQNDKDSALYYYNLALNRAMNGSFMICGEYKEGQVNSYIRMGDLFTKKHQHDIAYEKYAAARRIAIEISYKQGQVIAEKSLEVKKDGIPSINPEKKRLKRE
jgi:tetratricopeptide (TPR) repeat protein